MTTIENGVHMEATTDQRHRLLESIFRRNHQRRTSGMEPLNLTMAYGHGLNRILRANLFSHQHEKDQSDDGRLKTSPSGQVIEIMRHATIHEDR